MVLTVQVVKLHFSGEPFLVITFLEVASGKH